jgi:hypothetical protein
MPAAIVYRQLFPVNQVENKIKKIGNQFFIGSNAGHADHI